MESPGVDSSRDLPSVGGGRRNLILLLLLCGLFSETSGDLQLDRLGLPSPFILGSSPDLGCSFSSEEGKKDKPSVYSVKWYKDGAEFYRFVPSETPQIVTFPVNGVVVNPLHSNETSVRLERVRWDTAGLFRCEVTSAQDFETASSEGNAEVVAIPRSGPAISGQKGPQPYAYGETVRLNCTSHSSDPLPELTWYINSGAPLPYQLIRYPWTREPTNLMTVTLGLQFRLTRQHLLPDYSVKVKCTAILLSVYLKSNEISLEVAKPEKVEPAESRDGKAQGSGLNLAGLNFDSNEEDSNDDSSYPNSVLPSSSSSKGDEHEGSSGTYISSKSTFFSTSKAMSYRGTLCGLLLCSFFLLLWV